MKATAPFVAAAAALGLILLAAAAAAPATARPATVFVKGHELNTRATVQWRTVVTHNGRSFPSTDDKTMTTTDSFMAFDVPQTGVFGGVTISTNLNWIQGARSDGRCSRPGLDLDSAYLDPAGGRAYCAETKYRSVSFWRATCKTAFTISVAVYDENDRALRLQRSGDFRPCTDFSPEEFAAGGRSAKRLRG